MIRFKKLSHKISWVTLVLFLAMTMLTGLPGQPAYAASVGGVTISTATDVSTLDVGEEFTVDISMQNASVAGIDFGIEWDTSTIEVKGSGTKPDPYVHGPTVSWTVAADEGTDIPNGKICYAASDDVESALGANLTIYSITFVVKVQGASYIRLFAPSSHTAIPSSVGFIFQDDDAQKTLYAVTSITNDLQSFTIGTPAVSTDATLSALALSGVTLNPAFATGTKSYTASVANSVASTTVTATATDAGATITAADLGVKNLNVGDNTIAVHVTAEDGITTDAYTVVVTRAAPASNDATLSALALSGVTLNPAFATGTKSYTASVANSVDSTTVSATTTDAGATITAADLGEKSLNVGENTITVNITAADGTTTDAYTVVVTRLSALLINGGALNQATQGVAYEVQLSTFTSGGTGNYTWAITSGSLPAGLNLNSNTGYLTGTPTTVGNYSFNVTVTDDLTPNANTATAAYTLAVAVPPGLITSFACSAIGNDTASFNWPLAAGATAIKIQYSLDNGTTWQDAAHAAISSTATTATVTGLTPSTAYIFKLVVTGGGNAGDSNLVYASTTPYGNLHGNILTTGLNGVAGASISVYASQTGNFIKSATSSIVGPGTYNISGLPVSAGLYVTVSKDYYITSNNNNVEVAAGDDNWQDFNIYKILTDTYPKVGAIQADGSKMVELLVQANGDLTSAYYVVLPNDALQPSAQQIKDGQDSSGAAALKAGSGALTAATERSFITEALAADATAYDIFVVLQREGSWSEIVQLDVTTPPAASSDTTITGVTVDGVAATVDINDPTVYNVELPMGTVLADLTAADIAVTATDANASVGTATTTDGGATWTVVVTAENGITEAYTINITVVPSNDASVTGVTVDGVAATVDVTDPTVYNVELPMGTVLADLTAADITVTPTDANATVGTPATTDGGATWTVEVTAQDGTTKETYTINVTVVPSNDDSVTGVTVDGVAAIVDGTDPTVYNVELPSGTVLADLTAADIAVTPTDANATVGTPATTDGGATWTVEVTAQDGTTKETYTINVTVAADTTPPEFADGYPQAGTDVYHPGSKHVNMIVKPKNETVKAYYVAVAHGAATPASNQVIAGNDSADNAALVKGSQDNVAINGYSITPGALPADNTVYDFWVVIEDAAGNASSPAKVELTTPIKLLTDGYPVVGAAQAVESKQVEILNKANGDATAYYMVVADGATAPLAGQIMQGSEGSYALTIFAEGEIPLSAGIEDQTLISLPADSTAYDIYVMLYKDYHGGSFMMGIYSEIVKLDVTTPPAKSTVNRDPGNTGGAGASFDAVTNTFSGTIDYYPAAVGFPPTAGNYVGVQITAPTGITAGDDAYIKVGDAEYDQTAFDGTNYFYYYPRVTAAGQSFDVTVSWDGIHEEIITINVAVDAVLTGPGASSVTRDPGNTGGAGASFDAVTNTFSGTIDYYPAAAGFPPTAGNYVGVKITAPTEITVDATNATFKYNQAGVETTLTGTWLDGDNFVYYYPKVTSVPQSFTVVIDWDGSDGYAEETIIINVAADAVLITPISIAAIPGVTAPVKNATPVTTITETAQYTGTVTWDPAHSLFAASTVYTATITLTAKPGFTLTGVAENFFTVAGAITVNNAADTGVITAVFPKTSAASSGGGGGGGALPGFAIPTEGTTAEDYDAIFEFPEDAVKYDTRGDIERFSSDKIDAPEGSFVTGYIFELTKTAAGDFLKPITVTLPYKTTAVDLEKYDLSIYWYDEDIDEWVELDNVTVDEEDLTVSGKTKKTGYFAVIATKKAVVPPVEPEPEVPVLTDISGHWAEANIEYLVEMGAIAGYPDNTFRPDNSITRAEFAVVIVKAFDLKAASGKVFDDTANHWAKDFIATAAANGIVTGYSDQQFGPDELITREQMAVMIVKAAKLTTLTGELTFSDKADVSAWANSWVVTATKNKLMSGYPDNTFKPQGNATRAEAVTVIYNALK